MMMMEKDDLLTCWLAPQVKRRYKIRARPETQIVNCRRVPCARFHNDNGGRELELLRQPTPA